MRISSKILPTLVSLAILVIANLYIFQVSATTADSLNHVYFLDIGQGDATLIRTSAGENILIDGGPDTSIIDQLDRHIPFWDRSLDLVLLTHAHADHATGLLKMLPSYEIKSFWYTGAEYDSQVYQELIASLNQKQIPVSLVSRGDQAQFQDTTLKILYPTVKSPTDSDPNATSLVGVVSIGDLDIALTGDIGIDQETYFIDQLSDIEVLKVAHHGSKFSTSDQFLNRTTPEYGVISVGQDNSYNHPDPQLLSRLSSHHVNIFRTDQDKTIHLSTDGQAYKILSER